MLGHSFGAMVMWATLEEFEGELESLLEGVAVIDQDPCRQTGRKSLGPHDHIHAEHARISAELRQGQHRMMKQLRQLFTVQAGFAHSEVALSEWDAFASKCDHSTVASLHWDAVTSDFCHIVESMKTRVLVVSGDATIGSQSSLLDRTARCIPPHGAHCAILAGGCHLMYEQHEILPKLMSMIYQLLDGTLEMNVSSSCQAHPQHVVVDMLVASAPTLRQQMTACWDWRLMQPVLSFTSPWRTGIHTYAMAGA